MSQVLELPEHGSPEDASWQLRSLPGTSILHFDKCGCVLSDGRFAIFGGKADSDATTSSCEALTLDAHSACWSPLPPMHEPRRGLARAAMGECVIVAGGEGSTTLEVYEEGVGRWRRLPCCLPHNGQLLRMGRALM
jgi:hypothetical protein